MENETLIRSGGIELIDSIQDLWEELKSHHLVIDKIYPDGIAKADFGKRKKDLIEKGNQHLIELAETAENGEVIGYCLSTINENGIGELDSIFVTDSFRSRGIGKDFVRRSLDWMDQMHAKAKKVNVLEVNQEAVNLYKHFGFQTRQLEMLIPGNPSNRQVAENNGLH